eukprot:s4422_g2.t1
MRAGALAAAHAPALQSIQRSHEDADGPSKEFILKRLKSSPSGILDVKQSPKWLKLDRIHHDHVARVAQTEVDWILTPQANLLIAVVIAFQSFLLGAEVSLELDAQQSGLENMPLRWSIAFEFLDVVLLLIFSVEYALRCHALQRRFMTSFAGIIDLLLLVTGIFSAVVVAIDLASGVSDSLMMAVQSARRLRIFRIGRILSIFPALSMLIKGLIGTMVAIMDSMILIGMMSFMGALVCCEAMGREAPFEELFGSVGSSFLIHLQLVLVEAWPDIAEVMMQNHPLWALYVIAFLILSNFTILNVVTGVVCDGVLELASGKPPFSAQEQYLKFEAVRDEISDVYKIGPKDIRGQLDRRGYVCLLKSLEAKVLLDKMHIALPSTKDLENLLDTDHNRSISCEELQEGLMRLRGSRVNLIGLDLQCRLFRNYWSATAAMWHAESSSKTASRKATQRLSDRILDGMEVSAINELEAEPNCRREQQLSELQGVFDHLEKLRESLEGLKSLNTLNQQCQCNQEEMSPVSVRRTGTQTDKSQASFIPMAPDNDAGARPLGLPIQTRRGPLGPLPPDWLGYFRANSVVNTGAIVEVLRFLSSNAGWSPNTPIMLGRGIIAEQHGVTMPALSWGGDMLEVIWSSRGIFMNRPALQRTTALMTGRAGREMPMAIVDLTRLFIPQLPVLQSGLVFAFGGDNHMQGLAEFVFAAALRARDPELKLRWMPNQAERFMEGEMLLERFAFRLASATFGWSKIDWKKAGGKPLKRRAGFQRPLLKRFSQGRTKLWGSCLWKDVQQLRCQRSLLPQCILVFHPVDSAELMRDLHYTVSRTACLAAPNLKAPGVPLANAPAPQRAVIHRGQLFTKAYSSQPTSAHRVDSRASPWCQTVTKNRRLLSRLVSFSWSPRPGRSSRSAELVSGRGKHRPCPKLHFAPRLRPAWENFEKPLALHRDEWVRGPSGQVRLKHPVTILLSLPNSGTTWIMTVLEAAQKNKGCIAGTSDILHPNCNGLLMKELSKVAGAPDHDSWPNIFESPPAAAMDFLFELVTDQLHGKALSEVQQMRLTGATLAGEPLHPALVWPWKGLMAPQHDATRIGLVLTKEIINVFQVSKYLEMRHRSGLRPDIVAFALYRHRAHCFPMSNVSLALCKECWYHQMLRAFETADFSSDPAMRGIQRFWLSRGHLVGGRSGPSGMVFAHLVAWFPAHLLEDPAQEAQNNCSLTNPMGVFWCLWCLLLYHAVALRHLEDDWDHLDQQKVNDSTTAAFQFSIINNSSLPLNFLALPKLAQIYAHTKNRVRPGEKFSFLAALGAYDLHVTVQDGQNDWYQASETTWGLTKEGISLSISIAAGAGITGSLAVTAAAAVTASLTAVAAPLTITLAATATFWGVAVFSTMACSFLSEVSVNFLREQLEEVEGQSDGIERLRSELNHGRLNLVDLTHRFGQRASAHFDNGIEYLCCCTNPTKTAMVCEVVPADSPSKHWFRSGCPAILGDDYQSFLETLKDDSFKGVRHRGRCVVPDSPFAQLTTGPERLVPFSRVVRQAEVVEAVQQSFSALDVNYTVMTLATAERFFTAMQSKFSEWKIVKGGERKFVVAGGFMNPTPLPMASGKEPWTEIEFLPLQMGEIEPTHGCQLNDDLEFWRSKEKECKELCNERGSACMRSCVAPFKDALDQEVERDLELQRLARLEGQTVQVLQKEAFLEAAAVAMVPFTKKMESLMGSIGQVLDVDTHFLTAQVKFPKDVVKFPLEALATLGKGRKGPEGPKGARPSYLPSPSLHPVLSGERRRALSSPRFGQCWSACSVEGFWNSAKAGLKVAATLGSNGAWCYTAPAKQLLRAQPFGLRVLDYARLLVLDRLELRKYLNETLPGNLIRNPGVEALAESFLAFRFDDPPGFLAKRERSYRKLGAEPFARAAIAEMQRLAPHLDLSLLSQSFLTNINPNLTNNTNIKNYKNKIK